MSQLSSSCPEGLKKIVLPFLQRADELEAAKHTYPAYFIRTYVAQLVLANRNPADADQKKFLLDVLGYLEDFKKEHADLQSLDGRTVVTRLALTLFAKADELERQHQCSPAICKMFFTASVLFEATKQFNEGKMDTVAAEKHKYARFIAGRMTKCLKEGGQYESLNKLEGGESESAPADNKTAGDDDAGVNNLAAVPSHQPPPAPPTAQQQLPPIIPVQHQQPVAQQPPPPAYVHQPPPPQQQQQQQYAHHQPPPPQQQHVQQPPPPPPQQQPQQHQQQYAQHQQPPVPQQQQHHQPQPAAHQQPPPPFSPPAPTSSAPPPPAHAPQSHAAQNTYMSSASTPAVAEDELDRVMEAQKIAKQAIAALQFADVPTAKARLQRALQILG